MAWQLAGSVAAVTLLVVLAWKLGFAGPPVLQDEEHARALADEVPGGFVPVAVTIDRSRNGALLRDAAGRVVLVAPAGAHFVARLLGRNTTATCENGSLRLSGQGLAVGLDLGGDADDWAEAIARLE